LSTLLGLPQDRIQTRLGARLGFVWLKRRLSQEEVAAVRAEAPALPGVYLAPEAARTYPLGDFAGPLLGFTGVDNQGLSGLEYAYNRYLKGRRGWIERVTDAAGLPVTGTRGHVGHHVGRKHSMDGGEDWARDPRAAQCEAGHGSRDGT
jgi:cell division protein FtsI/penicillin-binding protein 2